MKKELITLLFLLTTPLYALPSDTSFLSGISYGYNDNIYRDSSHLSSTFLEESFYAAYTASAFQAEAFISHIGFASETSENQLLMNLALSYDLLLSMKSTFRFSGEGGRNDYTEWEDPDLTTVKGSLSYIYDDLSRTQASFTVTFGSNRYGLDMASNNCFEGAFSFQRYYALDDSFTLTGYFRHHTWKERRLETGHGGRLLSPSSNLFGFSLSMEWALAAALTLTPRLYWESQKSNMTAIIPAEIEPLVEQDSDTYHCSGGLLSASLALGPFYFNPSAGYFHKEYPDRISFEDAATPSDEGVTLEGWNLSAEGRVFVSSLLAATLSWEWDHYRSDDYWSRGSGYSVSAGLFLLF